LIDTDFYPAPTSHRLWRAPEADLPPSYFFTCHYRPENQFRNTADWGDVAG